MYSFISRECTTLSPASSSSLNLFYLGNLLLGVRAYKWLGSVSESGIGPLDSESRDPVPDLETQKSRGPVPDLETQKSRGPVPDPETTLRGLSRGPGVNSIVFYSRNIWIILTEF